MYLTTYLVITILNVCRILKLSQICNGKFTMIKVNILQGPFTGRSYPNSTMIGIGITPEGINQNDVVYEFMLEHAWRKAPENLSSW